MSNAIALPALAAQINQHHEQAEEHARSAVEHIYQCGVALIAAKAQCNHGEWLPWLETNTVVSKRTAQLWMQIAANPELAKSATAAHLSTRDLVKLVSKPKLPAFTRFEEMTPEQRHKCIVGDDALLYGEEFSNQVLQVFTLMLTYDGMAVEEIAEYFSVSILQVAQAREFNPSTEWLRDRRKSCDENMRYAQASSIRHERELSGLDNYSEQVGGFLTLTDDGADKELAPDIEKYKRMKKRDAYLAASGLIKQNRPALSVKLYGKGMKMFDEMYSLKAA